MANKTNAILNDRFLSALHVFSLKLKDFTPWNVSVLDHLRYVESVAKYSFKIVVYDYVPK